MKRYILVQVIVLFFSCFVFASPSPPVNLCILAGGAGATESVVYVAANDDDGYKRETTGDWYSNASGSLSMGWTGVPEHRSGHYRFLVNIPDGSTINSAILKLRATSNKDDGAIFDIYAEDTNNSAQINNVTEYNTAVGNLTTASVNWDLPATIEGNDYSSGDLKTVLQEVVDDNSGSTYLQLFLVSTASTASFLVRSYESGSNYAELTVNYN